MVLISGVAILYAVISHLKKIEREKYYMAAGNIVREDFLDYSLQNPMNNDGSRVQPKTKKMMVYIKSKSSGKKAQFVFDPEKNIFIGRDKFNSNIYINESSVSQHHCKIFSQDNIVYLQDMNSSNGTVVQRGLFKKFLVSSSQWVQLQSNDTIIVGTKKLKIILFFYDMSVM